MDELNSVTRLCSGGGWREAEGGRGREGGRGGREVGREGGRGEGGKEGGSPSEARGSSLPPALHTSNTF